MRRSSVYFYFLCSVPGVKSFHWAISAGGEMRKDWETVRCHSYTLHWRVSHWDKSLHWWGWGAGDRSSLHVSIYQITIVNCVLCVNCQFSWRFDKYAFACRLGILFQINWMTCMYYFDFLKSSYYLSKNDLIKCRHHMQLQLIKGKCGVKRENQLNVTFNVFKWS